MIESTDKLFSYQKKSVCNENILSTDMNLLPWFASAAIKFFRCIHYIFCLFGYNEINNDEHLIQYVNMLKWRWDNQHKRDVNEWFHIRQLHRYIYNTSYKYLHSNSVLPFQRKILQWKYFIYLYQHNTMIYKCNNKVEHVNIWRYYPYCIVFSPRQKNNTILASNYR